MQLDFYRFIADFQTSESITKKSVHLFSGSEYPFLFFMQLRFLIQRTMAVEVIDIAQEDIQLVIGRLSTSFLGCSVAYFITGLETDSRTKDTVFLAFLQSYTGPHIIIAYISPDKISNYNAHFPLIEVPEKVDKIVFGALLTWFGIVPSPQSKNCIQQLYSRFEHISFEHACIIMRYIPLGIKESQFFEEWLNVIITPEQSMFSLSQYLFQKNSNQFFIQWKMVMDAYSPQFWIAFWSEQLWRASMFINLSKQRKYNDARKIAFRLPFSFINRDWRNYTQAELMAAHDFVYQLDYRFKNSDNSIGLDLFYARFFEL